MPAFHYTARDEAGAEHHGTIAAEDEATVRKTLRYRGLHAISIVAERGVRRRWGFLAGLFGARDAASRPERGRKSRSG